MLIAATVALLALAVLLPGRAAAADTTYEALWQVEPNGDASVKLVMTLPMIQYEQLRNNVSNLYLLMRQFASQRADAEVADKHAEWDNANRTVTFTMTSLGEARNTGSRWEIDVPKGMTFSNLDEAKRMFHFNETGEGAMGKVSGISRLELPETATDFKWEADRRVISFALPIPKAPSKGSPGLTIAGGALIVLGCIAVAVSLVMPTPAPAQPE